MNWLILSFCAAIAAFILIGAWACSQYVKERGRFF